MGPGDLWDLKFGLWKCNMKAMHFQDVPGSCFRTLCCIHIEFRVILASVLVFASGPKTAAVFFGFFH